MSLSFSEIIEYYMYVVAAYAILPMVGMQGNGIYQLTAKLVEPLVNPIKNILGGSRELAAIALIIGLVMLKDHYMW